MTKVIEKVELEDQEYDIYSKECKKIGRSRRRQATQLIREFLSKCKE